MFRKIQRPKNRGTIVLLTAFTFIISCSNKKVEELSHNTTSKKADSQSVQSSCHQCYDSLKVNESSIDQIFKATYNRVIVAEKPQSHDYCLLFWFLLNCNDESLSESMGEYTFNAFKGNKFKQKEVREEINHFPQKMQDSLLERFINMMSIDIEEYSDVGQFKVDFPFLVIVHLCQLPKK